MAAIKKGSHSRTSRTKALAAEVVEPNCVVGGIEIDEKRGSDRRTHTHTQVISQQISTQAAKLFSGNFSKKRGGAQRCQSRLAELCRWALDFERWANVEKIVLVFGTTNSVCRVARVSHFTVERWKSREFLWKKNPLQSGEKKNKQFSSIMEGQIRI